MSTALAQMQFAADFVTFLAAATGLALVVLNGEVVTDSRWTRLAFAAGFLAMGVAAFGHGSLLLTSDDAAVVGWLRSLGIAGLAAGTVGWRPGRWSRRLVWSGLALTAGSLAADTPSTAVVAGMGDALVARDAEGRITDFNHAAEELTGVDGTSALGRAGDDVLALVDEDGTPLGDRVRFSNRARWAGLATVAHNPPRADPRGRL